MKSKLLALASLRFYRRHPWQLGLAILGIALGIAVFVGIQLANDNARRAFELSSSAAQGQLTHRLLPATDSLAEDVYFALKRDRRYLTAAPVIESAATIDLPDGRTLGVTLRGIDLIEEPALRSPAQLSGLQANALQLMSEPGSVLLPQGVAALPGAAPEPTIELAVGERRTTLRVVGTYEGAQGTEPVVITDIATAQSVAGLDGRISRVDLALDAAAALALAAALPNNTVLVPATEDQALRELTRAFNTNLSVLGLLALVVGMFLIYSTISFTIVQRSRSIAVMRALGLDRRELLTLLLGEALVIGLIGTLLGLVLGRLLSSALLELVLRTIGDLYFRRSLAQAETSNLVYLMGGAVGIAATLLSSLVPAVAASRREIASAARSGIERSARRITRLFAWTSLPLFGLALLVLIVGPPHLWLGYLALGLVLAGGAMLVPLATRGLMRFAEAPLAASAGIAGRMAARGVTDSLSRTGVATTALAVAVATVMSIGLMIGSFRASLIDWIDTTAAADLYLDPTGASGNDADDVLATLQTAMTSVPGVEALSAMRVTPVATRFGQLSLRAIAPGPAGYGFDLAAPADAAVTELFTAPNALFIAEPLAYRLELGVGDRIDLPAANGMTSFRVSGVYRDYNTGGSEVAIPLSAYRRLFADQGVTTIGVHLEPQADENTVVAAIRELPGGRSARIRSTARIREISLLVFDQTFQITEVLRLLAAIVAFLGIMSGVSALQLEREREFAVLRSIGMSVRQLFGQNLAQTALLGMAAGVTAVPLGTALAWLLVQVINKRSFGWSMDFVLTPGTLLSGLGMAIAAAVLAGLYPGFVGARADTGLAWRDD